MRARSRASRVRPSGPSSPRAHLERVREYCRILADDLADLAEHAPAQGQVVVDAGADLAFRYLWREPSPGPDPAIDPAFVAPAEASCRGADVVLIAGPSALPTPYGVKRIDVRTAQQMAEAVEEGAQVGAGLGFGRVGPELEGEVGAGLRGVAVEEQIGEEGLEAGGADAGEGGTLVVQTELAEEADIESWRSCFVD